MIASESRNSALAYDFVIHDPPSSSKTEALWASWHEDEADAVKVLVRDLTPSNETLKRLARRNSAPQAFWDEE